MGSCSQGASRWAPLGGKHPLTVPVSGLCQGQDKIQGTHTRSTKQNIFPAFGHCWLRGMKSKSEAILAHSKKHMVVTSFFFTQLDQTTLDFDASTASVNPNQAPQSKQGPVCTLPPQDHARTWRPHGRSSAGSHPRPPSSCPQ